MFKHKIILKHYQNYQKNSLEHFSVVILGLISNFNRKKIKEPKLNLVRKICYSRWYNKKTAVCFSIKSN